MGRAHSTRASFQLCAALMLVANSPNLLSQKSKPAEIQPCELVRAAVANELAAAQNTAIKFMFRSRRQTPEGVQNKIYVEGNEALATMTVSGEGQGLTPKVERTEKEHVEEFLSNPAKLYKEHERERQEVENTLRIVKALPDAFFYKYDGEVAGREGLGKPGDRLVRLRFTPNPSYSPPSRVEQVLQGMDGFLLIDATAKRLAQIDGTLFREVTFGWGIFGHLDKGGHFLVKQGEAADGYWAITEMNLHITGKILLVKNLSLISDEVFTDFHRLPDDLPYAKAVELLQNEQVKLAQGRGIQPAETTATR